MTDHIKTKEPVIIDSKLLPLFVRAEGGDIDAQIELAIAFGDGDGAKKNEELARRFETMMFNNTENVRLKLGTLYNPAIRAYEERNKRKMIQYFEAVLYFMLKNIPMEEWDFSLIQTMHDYTQGEDKIQ